MANKNMELFPNDIIFNISEETVSRLRKASSPAEIIGQDRAVCAIGLGLSIGASGYNIFVTGASGTGRRTVLTAMLEKYSGKGGNLQDIAFVYNFRRPLEPKALFFPPGRGSAFKGDLRAAVESARRKVIRMKKSEAFSRERGRIVREAEAEENRLLAEFEAEVAAQGFKLVQAKEGDAGSMDLVPVIKGKEISFDELQRRAADGKFPQEALGDLRESYYRALDSLDGLFKRMLEKRRAAERKARALQAQKARPIIEEEFAQLRQKYAPSAESASADEAEKAVAAFLGDACADLASRVSALSSRFKSRRKRRDFFGRYEANLFCEAAPDGKGRVVQEKLPTFANLFGSIDLREDIDLSRSDAHLRLRAGAVHRAAGGFLVLRMQDLLLEEGAWSYLKRVLQSGRIEFQNPPASLAVSASVKPDALPAKFKAVIIGGEDSYDFLYSEDPDFQKLFKVCAAFDDTVPLSDSALQEYISFADSKTREARLPQFTDAGLARLLKEVVRASGARSKLSAKFTLVSDLILESACRKEAASGAPITAEDVAAAVRRKRFLLCLDEERFLDRIARREIIVDVQGEQVGKVNGLAVLDSGYYEFGIPVVVTAQAGPGNKGIINIEGEAGLSGEIYDKAHLIIQGLLSRKYLRGVPLCMDASVCFEQSYSGIDGDSASCAEFFALVSAVSQVPLSQGIAVTGSLNQLGDVQPVGDIPQKIEGFYNTCAALGLTGEQGVIIPKRNLDNLILSDRLEEAILAGKFHIWAVGTADEALEIISGKDSSSITEATRAALEQYADTMRSLKS